MGLCRNLDLDPDEAERVLTEKTYKKAVDNDWLYSKSLGITAVPTFRAAGLTVVGAQPYETLEEQIKSAMEKVDQN